MKNIFTPLFIAILLLLTLINFLQIDNPLLFPPVISICITGFLICFRFKYFKPAYILMVLCLGLLICMRFITERNDYLQRAAFPIPTREYITLDGELTDYPEIAQNFSYLTIHAHGLEFENKRYQRDFNARIKIQGRVDKFFKGDKIRIDTSLYSLNFNWNFSRNRFEDYVFVNKIHVNGYCKSGELITLIKKTSWWWRMIGEWRNTIRNTIEKKYRTQDIIDKKGVLLLAITIGERGDLTNEQEKKFIDSGTYHLLSISGAHIGIIALLSLGILNYLKVSRKKKYLITSFILLLFLALSGFNIPAERAVLMAILIFIARLLFRNIHIFNIISLTGLLFLIQNPSCFLDAGFILTFSLTAAIAAGRKIFIPIIETFSAKKNIPLHPSGPNSSPHLLKEKKTHWFTEFITANISASLMSLPLSLYYFNQYSFSGFFAGFVLIPLTALITGAGLLLIPLAPLSSFLSGILLFFLHFPLILFFKAALFFSETLKMVIYRPSPSLILIILLFILYFLGAGVKYLSVKIISGIILLAGCVFISIPPTPYNPSNLEVFILDVGQGDSNVIVFPGGDALLVDAGGAPHAYSDFEVGKRIVLPFLLEKRIQVRWIAASHHHPDHIEGISEIISILKPEELWISSRDESEGDTSFNRLIQSIPPSTKLKICVSPFIKRIHGCLIQYIFPNHFITGIHATNNQSMVLRVSDSFNSFLFPGDIEKEVEKELAEKNCPALHSTVIKVPHHGSISSSSIPFLQCVSPHYAVFSTAKDNQFKFPHPGVLANYRSIRAQCLSTAKSGGIRFISTTLGIRIETSR